MEALGRTKTDLRPQGVAVTDSVRTVTLRFVPVSALSIREDVPLAPYTTLGIGGSARFFSVARSEADIAEAVEWARMHEVALFVLGGGSNLLVRDTGFDGLVLQVAIRGLNSSDAPDETSGEQACVEAAAGEPWDTFVDYAVERGLAGVECLAGIPGLVGGTPVQNVGAYGQEVADTIVSVRALDLGTSPADPLRWVELTHEQCRFRYRESLFNTGQPGRFIVTGVRFRLRRNGIPNLRYAELERRFAPGAAPSLATVAATVRAIRREKGMVLTPGDPDCRSAGSFFKNPIIPVDLLNGVAEAAGLSPKDVPHWPAGQGRIKLPAAWLLERAGFRKGYGEGAAGISSRHTLALINRGGATCQEMENLQHLIVAGVAGRFGITLEREPVLLG